MSPGISAFDGLTLQTCHTQARATPDMTRNTAVRHERVVSHHDRHTNSCRGDHFYKTKPASTEMKGRKL
jgi:hypothetical protein